MGVSFIRKTGAPLVEFSGLTGFLVVIIAGMSVLSGDAGSALAMTASAFVLGIAGRRFPAASFGLLACLLYPSAGLAYFGITGRFPGGDAAPTYVHQAYIYLALSLTVIMAIYSFCSRAISRVHVPNPLRFPVQLFRQRSDAWAAIIVIAFIPDWLGLRFGGPSLGGFSQVVQHILAFRFFLLAYFVVVTFSISDTRTWFRISLICLFVALPTSAVSGSGWSGVIILLAFIGSYLLTIDSIPFAKLILQHFGIFLVAVSAIFFLISFGLIWEGGLKTSWRDDLRSGNVAEGTMDRLEALGSNFEETLETFEAGQGAEALAARMSSGQGYFSLVLQRSHAGVIDHHPGIFLSSAFVNLVPRLFWPNKPNLGGDSWMVNRFAGLNVAGDAQGASIGLGFVAQFYIEGGLSGVLLGSAALGVLLFISHFTMRRTSQSKLIGDVAFLVIVVINMTTYDASYPKILNALIYQTIIFAILIIFMRTILRMGKFRRLGGRWKECGTRMPATIVRRYA